jgi:hypothetical protein
MIKFKKLEKPPSHDKEVMILTKAQQFYIGNFPTTKEFKLKSYFSFIKTEDIQNYAILKQTHKDKINETS